jgi:hypothetical protein
MCNVSRQAVSKALKQGFIVATDKGIDPAHPTNQNFMKGAIVRKEMRAIQASKPKEPKAKKPRKTRQKLRPVPDGAEDIMYMEGGPLPKNTSSAFEDIAGIRYQKEFQATRLNAIKADAALLKYAQDIDAVVDITTLNQKIGQFSNFLQSRLISFPEENSAFLWMSAEADDDPERRIREILTEKIADIISAAKDAALEVAPPQEGVKYIVVNMEDADEFEN